VIWRVVIQTTYFFAERHNRLEGELAGYRYP
jgi:hypothetical protein